MIRANELRIGNCINYNGCLFYVYSIESALPRGDIRYSDKDLVTLFDGGLITVPIEDIKLILLTEEWLVKFGFIKSDYFDIIEYYKESTSIKISLSDEVCKKGVHWFQNWYYFETNEELTISQQ